MAASRLLAVEVSDLCLGKPPLRSLPISATIRHALTAIKSSDDTHISIWECKTEHHHCHCRCIGKICMVDIICYLCKQDNISSPTSALNSPVSALLSDVSGLVTHVEPSSSLLEAIHLIINGAQNLIIPIKNSNNKTSKRKQLRQYPQIAPTIHAGGREYCWLTQEDVIRFLLSSIGLFSPTAAYSIDSLGIITTEILTINYHSPASEALQSISTSLSDQTSVAVVDDDGVLIGEISPFTLNYCDEMVAAAITTLSAGDLMAFIDCGGPPEDLIKVVESRLKERNLIGMVEEFSIYCKKNSSSPARIMRRVEAIVCYPGSSLVAVMIQAIAHRINYVWVIEEEDGSVVGIVKFSGMLEVFRRHLESLIKDEYQC